MECKAVKCGERRGRYIINGKKTKFSQDDIFVIPKGSVYSLMNKSKSSSIDIECKIYK